MRYRIFLIYGLLLSIYLNSQVNISTSLPASVNYNSQTDFSVIIQKGPLKNYTKYQLTVPEGIVISEVESNNGSFSFETNTVKIIWAITPPENEFKFSLKLVTGKVKGDIVLHQKYYYLEKGEKKEINIAPVYITVRDSAAPNTPSKPEIVTSSADDKKTNAIDSLHYDITHITGSTEEMKSQVSQLKKDSKEATEIGEQEKKAAEKRLAEASEALKKAEEIPDKQERNLAIKNANLAKEKAQSDLEVANRILVLAKTLDSDANEIEKLNMSLDSLNISYKDAGTGSGDNKPVEETAIKDKLSPEAKIKIEKIEKARKAAIEKGKKNARDLYKPFTMSTQNFSELKAQVMQLKKDSRDAMVVGKEEKKKAELKLENAYAQIKAASYIKDDEEKKVALEKASKDKQQAENDLEIASKIMTLAKSLEDNAKEIERLNVTTYAVDTVANIISKASPTPSPEPVAADHKSNNPEKSESHKDVDKLHDMFKPKPENLPEKKGGKQPLAEVTTTKETGLVFKIQIGSFTKQPDRSQFISLGKVTVINEDGKYKALYGSFISREEAVKRKQDVIAKGFDGFIVSYQDGVKVK